MLLLFIIDVLECFYIVFELLLGHLVDLVYHEYVLLKATQELLEARLGRPLRWLLRLGAASSGGVDRGGARRARVLHFETLVRMAPAHEVIDHALYGIPIRQHIDIVVIDEVVGG